jgi:hypothetical protein
MNAYLRHLILLANCAKETGAVTANNLLLAIDHDLRGVDTVEMEPLTVSFLALCVGRRREGIRPAQAIPVGDVFAHAHDELTGVAILSVDLLKKGGGQGQLEHPSDVKSSTRTARCPGCVFLESRWVEGCADSAIKPAASTAVMDNAE